MRKEVRTELRNSAGLLTIGLFSFSAVVAMALAAFNLRLGGPLAAGMLWTTLLFAAVVGLPRTMVLEEEQGTGDLLRLTARPEAVYYGKLGFNLILMTVTGLGIGGAFIMLTNTPVASVGLFLATLLAGSIGLAATVTLCGALVAQGANRSTVSGAIGIPLLLPLVVIGVASMRGALDPIYSDSANRAVFGLVGYALLSLVSGAPIFAATWKR
ncbi:MAG: heme exporter protein CcmB [Fimbriimonas sp.]